MLDLDTFRSQYAGEIAKAQKRRGFRGVLDQLNSFLDEQLANKQDKEKMAAAQQYDTQKTQADQAFRTSERVAGQEFEQSQGAAKLQADQSALDMQNTVNEKIAPWHQQAMQAASSIYQNPNDTGTIKENMARLEEARMYIDQLGGPGISEKLRVPSIQGVQETLTAIRAQISQAQDASLNDLKMTAINEAQKAMDDLAEVDPNDKAAHREALRKFHRSTVRFQQANDPSGYLKAAGDFMGSLPGGGFGDMGDMMTPTEQNAMSEMISKAGDYRKGPIGEIIPGVDVSLLPKGATVDPDSAAVARAMLSQMKGDSTDVQTAADVRSSMKTDFLEPRKRQNPIADIISLSRPEDDTKAAIRAIQGKQLRQGLSLKEFTAGVKEKFPNADIQKVLEAVSGF